MLAPAIYLRSLDEKATYRLESTDGKLLDGEREVSGAYLMGAGVHLRLGGDFDSTAVVITKVE